MIASLSIYDSVAQIEVAVDDSRTALIIRHLLAFTEQDLVIISQFAEKYNFWIYFQSKGPDTVTRFYPSSDQTPYYMQYCLDGFGIKINFQPHDFTQVNQEINHKIVQYALSLLEASKTDTVLDLFSGLGNFSLPYSTPRCQTVFSKFLFP